MRRDSVLRKIFYYITTRLKLWVIYGRDIPILEGDADYKCPTCYWDSTNDDVLENAYLTDMSYGYEGNASWIEHFTCPVCGTKFDVRSGV